MSEQPATEPFQSVGDEVVHRPCRGVTYLNWGLDEDGVLTVTVECNGGLTGDCGWSEDVTDEMGVDDLEYQVLVTRHRAHREAQADG